MRLCEVEPKSKRGKQLVKEHGTTWYLMTPHSGVESMSARMPCFDNALGFRIKSLDGEHTRNVRMINDQVLNVYYIKD